MRYVEHRPPHELAPWVECLWSLEDGRAGGARPLERVVPDGCMEIIVHLGPRFRTWYGPGTSRLQPRAFVVGQLTRVLVLEPGDAIDTLGIRLRPAGARAILHAPLSDLLDRTVALEDLLGRAGARFARTLLACDRPAERLRVAERFLRDQLAAGSPPHPAVRHAVARVLGGRGRIRVERLAKDLGWSARQLERRFARDVGLPPKKLARIVRVNALLARLRADPAPDWADLALELGFSDQSHLIREFGALVGASPGDRRALEGELAAFFTSAARLSAYFGDA